MISTIVHESFGEKRQRLAGVVWHGSQPRELLSSCPDFPADAEKVKAGYRDYELIDVGRERWRLQLGRPVAYFLYTVDKKDPRWPWEAVWLDDGYLG